MSEFLTALRRELDAAKEEYQREDQLLAESCCPGYYTLLENFNLGKHHNSELAWTMNRNHTGWSSWRLRG